MRGFLRLRGGVTVGWLRFARHDEGRHSVGAFAAAAWPAMSTYPGVPGRSDVATHRKGELPAEMSIVPATSSNWTCGNAPVRLSPSRPAA
jgi:hypothetical protein